MTQRKAIKKRILLQIESRTDENSQYYLDILYSHELDIPTEKEEKTLRRILGGMPVYECLVCLVVFAERGSYYSVSEVLTNFIQRPLPDGSTAGTPVESTPSYSAGALN